MMELGYILKAYDDGLAYGEEYIRAFPTKEEAKNALKTLVEEDFGLEWDEIPKKVPLTKKDVFSSEYVSITTDRRNTMYYVVDELKSGKTSNGNIGNEPAMRFLWKDYSDWGIYKCVLYEGEKEIDNISFIDNTCEYMQARDKKYGIKKTYSFDIYMTHDGYRHYGLDYDPGEHEDGGYQGNCTHTVEDVERLCENLLAEQHFRYYSDSLQNYSDSLQMLLVQERRARWFESKGFVFEEDPDSESK